MAKRVFFSFHYQDVIDFRANVVRHHWVTKDDREEAGYFDASLWESSKRTGDDSLKRLINDGLDGTTVTAVLCHSHKDRDLALGLKTTIESQGGSLYIDWLDDDMPETPNKETAQRIKGKIVECDLFMFLATPNSMASRWCPWEIGYADGKKPADAIVIVPTKDDAGRYYGNEYLQLYRRLEPSAYRVYGQTPAPTIIRPGEYSGVPVQQL